MNYIKRLLCLLLMGLGMQAQAGHVLGGDITWKTINTDTLLVTVTVYRDCNEKALDNAPLRVSTNCSAKNFKTVQTGGQEVLPFCASQCSPCDTGSTTCTFDYSIQKWSLTAIVPLADYRSNACCDVNFSWSLCCRSDNITTGANQENFHLSAYLDICDSVNHEISWEQAPLGIVCLGTDVASSAFSLTSSNKADSLVHTLTEPLKGSLSHTTWNAPYSYSKPLYFLGFPKSTSTLPAGFHLDTTSGILQFTPMKLEVTTISVSAQVYRKGLLVGQSIRDQLLIIRKCPSNVPPIISGINCSSVLDENFIYQACAGETIAFDICTADKDKNDSTTLRIARNIDGSSFAITNTGDKRERARFSWTPTSADVSNRPYQLLVEVSDNACPLNNRVARVYYIYVNEPEEMILDTIDEGCGQYLFHAQGRKSIYFESFEWKIDQASQKSIKSSTSLYDTVPHRFYTPGTYSIQLKTYSNGSCAAFYKDSLVIPDNFLWIEHPETPDEACPGDSVELKLVAHTKTGIPTLIWKGIDSVRSDSSNIKVAYGNNHKPFYYKATEAACEAEGSVGLTPYRKYHVTIPNTEIGCMGIDSFLLDPFSNLNAFRDSITSFSWTDVANNLLSTDSILTVLDSGFYLLKTSSIRGCHYADTFYSELKAPTFQLPNDTAICLGKLAHFNAKSKYSGTFDWYASNSQLSYTGIDRTSLDLYAKELTKVVVQFNDERGGHTCSVRDSFVFDTLGLPKPFNVTHNSMACKGDSIQVSSASDSAVWTFQNRAFYGAKRRIPVLVDNQREREYPLLLTAISDKGCKSDTAMTVLLLIKPTVSFTLADSIFAYKDYQPTNTSPWTVRNIYAWDIGNPVFKQYLGDKPTFNFDTLGFFEVTLTVSDTVKGCSQSHSDTLRVVHNIHSPAMSAFEAYVYPNPASKQLNVQWNGQGGLEARLINLQGMELMRTTAQQEVVTLSLESLTTGTYLLLLYSGEQHTVRKIEVVQSAE